MNNNEATHTVILFDKNGRRLHPLADPTFEGSDFITVGGKLAEVFTYVAKNARGLLYNDGDVQEVPAYAFEVTGRDFGPTRVEITLEFLATHA